MASSFVFRPSVQRASRRPGRSVPAARDRRLQVQLRLRDPARRWVPTQSPFQTIRIGANNQDDSDRIDWAGINARLLPKFLEGGGTGYLYDIDLAAGDDVAGIEVRTRASLTAAPSVAGPDFTVEVERNPKAFVIRAGTLALTIPGPSAPGSVTPDTAEPYDWQAAPPLTESVLQDFITDYRALTAAEKAATTLTIARTPRVTIHTAAQTIDGGDVVSLSATATDLDDARLSLGWTSDGGGHFADPSVEDATWTAPPKTNTVQTIVLTLVATNHYGMSWAETVIITVRANLAPIVTIHTAAQTIDGEQTITLSATATDPDGDTLTLGWTSDGGGHFADPSVEDATWTAPPKTNTVQTIVLTLVATDATAAGSDTVIITVRAMRWARADPLPVLLRSLPEYAPGSQVLFPVTGLLIDDARIVEDTIQEGGISFSALRTEEWVEAAVPGTVVWFYARGTPKEFWLSSREDTYGADGSGIARFTADPLHTVLADVGIIELTTSGGVTRTNLGGPLDGMSATNYFYTFIRPWLNENGIDYVQLGSVESNERVKLAWAHQNPQQVWKALADKLGHEWRLRRDDAARTYKLDMGSNLGAELPTSRASEGINLISLRRLRDRETLATSIRSIGPLVSGATVSADISQNAWRVPTDGVSGDDVQGEAHNGLAGPIAEDGQWAGHYLEAPDGACWEIEDSTASTQTFQLEDGAGSHFAAGDDFRIVRDQLGTGITEVASPSAVRQFGRISRPLELDFRGERNWVRNPNFDDWPDAAGVYNAQFDGLHIWTNTVDLKNLPDGLVISAGDVFINGSHDRSHRIWSGGTVGSSGKLTIGASSAINGDNDHVVIIILSGSEPTAWSRDATREAFVSRRPLQSLPDLTCEADGDQEDIHILDLKGLTEGDTLYPGDLIGGLWVLEEATAASGGTVTVKTSGHVDVDDDDMVTVRRPLIDAEIGSGNMAVLSGQTISTVAMTVRPIAGLANRVYASCRFTAMGPTGWGSTNSPKLRLKQDGVEVAVATADGWAPTGEGDKGSFRVQTEPVELSDPGSYEIDFVIGASFFGSWLYLHWVMLHIGEVADVDPVVGSHATEAIQRTQKMLSKDSDWASTYSCLIDELADKLEVSPELIRSNVGALVHVNNPELGVSGALRIKGLAYNPYGARTEVALDRDVKLLTRETRRQKARTLFGEVDGQAFTTSEEPPRTAGVFRATAVSGADLTASTPVPVRAVS